MAETTSCRSLPSHPNEQRQKMLRTGEVPSALTPLSGCHFHPRCPCAMPQCSEQEPELVELAPGHQVACHLSSFREQHEYHCPSILQ